MNKRTCSVEGCGKQAQVGQWCPGHSNRARRWGDPLGERPTPAGTKWCFDCKSFVAIEGFNVSKSAKDGLQARCRPCNKAYQAAYYAKNKERIAQRRAEWRADNKEYMREYSRGWYQANRERKQAMGRAWREANADYLAEKGRQWRAENPNLVLEYAAKRRAVVRDAWDEYVDRDIVWERDAGICHICGEPADPNRWDLDHIVPLRPHDDGPAGRHNYGNVAVSHPSCNYRKNNRRLNRGEQEEARAS